MEKSAVDSKDQNMGRLFYFDDFVLDAQRRHLTKNGSVVKLTAKSFDLLQLLVQNHGKIVPREEILQKVWPEEYVEDSNVNVQVATLRKIFGSTKDFIQTVSKRGYCFTAKVGVGTPVNNLFDRAARSESEITSLAVLPLANLDKNEDLDYFADGLTESLINLLSKMSKLKVMAYRSITRFKGRDFDTAEIGKTLNVESVLTGRVRQFRDQVTISVELVRVSDESQIWGTSYEKPYSDIFQIQKEITQAIAGKLLPTINNTEKKLLGYQQTRSPEAYDAYLKGCHFLSIHTKEGFEKGLGYFQKALEIDPNYALSYLGIANSYFLLNSYSFSAGNETLDEINNAIEKAKEIAPNLAEVRATVGTIKYVYEWNWDEAEKEFLAAIKLNPNYTLARYWYVVFLMLSGRFAEADEQLKHLAVIDPLSLSLNKTYASLLFYQKRYEESIVQAEKTLELYPDCIPVYPAMSICFAKTGALEKGLDLMQKAYNTAPSPSRLAVLGYLHAIGGDKKKAVKALKEAESQTDSLLVDNFYIYVALGEIDKGFDYLENSLKQKELEHVALIVDPRADPVRDHPRFTEILEKIR
jgi:TolB-like protein/Tfp pilus assembly protein PilF